MYTEHPYSFPLTASHLQEAKLFANREDMITGLFPSPVRRICEIGVAFGDFSEYLIRTLKPEEFYAIDLFEMHEGESAWGAPTRDRFGGKTHLEFYEDRISPLAPRLILLKGLSQRTLNSLPDNSMDLIYIDAAHDYEGVNADTQISLNKVQQSGTLIFNDYVLYDPFQMTSYGIVQVVNELIVHSDWRVVGFALQRHMFCDIALRRSASPGCP